MPRPPRIYRATPGVPNHVVIRGNNRRRIFSYVNDRVTFIHYLAKALEKTQCRLHALALLTNHVHLEVDPPSVSALSELMRSTCWHYSRYRNARTGGSGKLFEERFWSRPLNDWSDVATVTAYIDLNPVGKLYGRPATDWSSKGLHLGETSNVPHDIWEPSPWYLDLGQCTSARIDRYREWIADYQLRRLERSIEEPLSLPCEHRGRLERPDRTSAR